MQEKKGYINVTSQDGRGELGLEHRQRTAIPPHSWAEEDGKMMTVTEPQSSHHKTQKLASRTLPVPLGASVQSSVDARSPNGRTHHCPCLPCESTEYQPALQQARGAKLQ